MAGRYAQGALQFSFPKDWELADEVTDGWPRSISLQIPGGGYWSVYHYPAECDRLPLLEEFVETIKTEYGDVEIIEAEEIIGEAFVDGFDLSFFCLDYVVDCAVRSLEANNGTLIWFYQAETQDFARRATSFKAVSESLLQNFAKWSE